jgi:hypothetical protein
MATPKKELHTLIIGAGKLSHLEMLFGKLIGNRNFRVNRRTGLEEGIFSPVYPIPIHTQFPPPTPTVLHTHCS